MNALREGDCRGLFKERASYGKTRIPLLRDGHALARMCRMQFALPGPLQDAPKPVRLLCNMQGSGSADRPINMNSKKNGDWHGLCFGTECVISTLPFNKVPTWTF
jgi:hypothetical protein